MKILRKCHLDDSLEAIRDRCITGITLHEATKHYISMRSYIISISFGEFAASLEATRDWCSACMRLPNSTPQSDTFTGIGVT
jgi:hypothetical protein